MEHQKDPLVVDTTRDRLGYVMGHEGSYLQLRPVTGGLEWAAEPASVRLATEDERLEAMLERTRALNTASRNRPARDRADRRQPTADSRQPTATPCPRNVRSPSSRVTQNCTASAARPRTSRSPTAEASCSSPAAPAPTIATCLPGGSPSPTGPHQRLSPTPT